MGFYGPTVVSWERYYWYLVSWGVKHFVIYCCDRAALINPIPSTCVCMCVCARFMVCGLLRPIVLPWRRYVNILFVPHCPWVCLILLAFRKKNPIGFIGLYRQMQWRWPRHRMKSLRKGTFLSFLPGGTFWNQVYRVFMNNNMWTWHSRCSSGVTVTLSGIIKAAFLFN